LQDRDAEIDLATAREILRYFLRNPQAADDLEGVARFRLLDEQIHRSVTEARAALEWLVAKGLLKKEQAGASNAIYRLNARSREEAERFLTQAGEAKKARREE